MNHILTIERCDPKLFTERYVGTCLCGWEWTSDSVGFIGALWRKHENKNQPQQQTMVSKKEA